MTAYMTAWAETRESPLPVAPSASGFRFSRLFPLYVDETQSRMRGLAVAWYVIDNDGAVTAGPYPNRDKCIERIGQLPDRSSDPELWRRPDSIRAARTS
jgi:hypothetical protein